MSTENPNARNPNQAESKILRETPSRETLCVRCLECCRVSAHTVYLVDLPLYGPNEDGTHSKISGPHFECPHCGGKPGVGRELPLMRAEQSFINACMKMLDESQRITPGEIHEPYLRAFDEAMETGRALRAARARVGDVVPFTPVDVIGGLLLANTQCDVHLAEVLAAKIIEGLTVRKWFFTRYSQVYFEVTEGEFTFGTHAFNNHANYLRAKGWTHDPQTYMWHNAAFVSHDSTGGWNFLAAVYLQAVNDYEKNKVMPYG
jgi:hypothetical protein